MATVKWHGAAFKVQLDRRIAAGLKECAATLKVDYQRALRISNKGGEAPSLAGEIPRKGTGTGLRSIVSFLQRVGGLAGIVAVKPEGRHLLMLDAGTRPHVIHAKGGKMLKIPWRGANARNPTGSSIKFFGLKRIGRGWFYFRKMVNHPGTLPRPWIIPILQRNLAKLGMIFASRASRP